MKKIKAAILLPIIATVIFNLYCCSSDKKKEKFVVTIRESKLTQSLQDGERIIGYKIKYKSGYVFGLLKIPDDWWVQTKPYMEIYQIEADAGHGVSWLTIDDVKDGAFEKFLIIKNHKEAEKIKIEVDLSIDIPSQEEETHIKLDESCMEIVPYS